MSDEVIRNMRSRVEKCHRLAASVLDDQAKSALLDMAAEIERDIRRLEAGRDDPSPI